MGYEKGTNENEEIVHGQIHNRRVPPETIED